MSSGSQGSDVSSLFYTIMPNFVRKLRGGSRQLPQPKDDMGSEDPQRSGPDLERRPTSRRQQVPESHLQQEKGEIRRREGRRLNEARKDEEVIKPPKQGELRSRKNPTSSKEPASEVQEEQMKRERMSRVQSLDWRAEEELNFLRHNNARLFEEVTELQHHTKRLQRLLTEQTSERENRMRHEIQKREGELDDLKNQNARLSSERDAMLEQIRIAQEGALQAMKKGDWAPKEDQQIRRDLTKLEDKLKAWAKTYSLVDINVVESASAADKNAIIDQLGGYCIQEDWEDVVSRLTPALAKRAPMLFTHGALAKEIYSKVFSAPFFVLRGHGKNSEFFEDEMSRLYERLSKVDKTEAHIWRSSMLRLLAQSLADPTSGYHSPAMSQAESNKLSLDFINGPSRLLFKQLDEVNQAKRQKELETLFCEAGELSLSLWCQRTFIKCYDLKMLGSQPFHAGHDAVIPHRLHKLDDEDDRLNGAEMIAVVQPLILAFGDEDAEGYDSHRIWAKAVVLIDENSHVDEEGGRLQM